MPGTWDGFKNLCAKNKEQKKKKTDEKMLKTKKKSEKRQLNRSKTVIPFGYS